MANNYPRPGSNYGVRAEGNTTLWLKWRNMNIRCYKEYCPQYRNYGGRGITVCDEWRHDARAFISWAKINGWEPGLSLDRIDNDGPYSPHNCRFATNKVQSRNRRANLVIFYKGKRKCLAEWCEVLGLNIGIVSERLKRGYSVAVAFRPSKPASAPLHLSHGGRTMTAKEWAKYVGVHESTIYKRYHRGEDLTAPRGLSGPKPNTVYRVKPGPKPRRVARP